MTAAIYDIIVEQYQDFARGFQLKEDGVVIDLTGYSFEAQLRERTQATTAWDFSTIVMDASQGLVNISMTDTTTGSIPSGYYVYDLIMVKDTGEKIRLLEGQARVKAGVTR